MKSLFKQYNAFFYGAILVSVVTLILENIGFLIIKPEINLENVLIFGFWWGVISLFIFRIQRLKHKWKFLGKIGILVSLLIGTILVESQMKISDNPATLFLLVLFWLYLFYLLAPTFFNSYKLPIIGLYTFAFIGYIYFRFFNGSFEDGRGYSVTLFLLPIPIFILLWIYEQWRWARSLQSEMNQAELALLKSQINPHFFFNTLNNLYSLTVNHSEKAPEVIVKLSEMMRYTIYEGKKDATPIEDEISFLHNYLELHEIRHHSKVAVSFSHEIKHNLTVAPLLFINLLENAIKHGVESMVQDAYIDIQLVADEYETHFRIENNYDPSTQENNAPRGMGLENLRRRLELMYPNNHSLQLSDESGIFIADLTLFAE